MIKFVRVIFRIVIALVVVVGGFIVYRLWDQGELRKENFNSETIGQLLKKEAEKLGGEVKDGSLALKDKIQNEWIDWEELKGNWSLSEDEFESFKRDSLAFLNETSSSILTLGQEKKDGPSTPATLEGKPVIEPEASIKSGAGVEREVKVPPKTTESPDEVERVDVKPVASPKVSSSPYPHLEKSSTYREALEDLEKAKEFNRNGLPGKPNAKANLKKAVTYYKKSQKGMEKASRTPGLNAKEQAHLEHLQEEISKQIYWGSKLGSL